MLSSTLEMNWLTDESGAACAVLEEVGPPGPPGVSIADAPLLPLCDDGKKFGEDDDDLEGDEADADAEDGDEEFDDGDELEDDDEEFLDDEDDEDDLDADVDDEDEDDEF